MPFQPLSKTQTLDQTFSALQANQAEVEAAITGKQDVAEKDQAGGYAGLDGSGKLAASQLPEIAISRVFPVADEAAMLALTAQVGDFAARADQNDKTYLLGAEPASILANWVPASVGTTAADLVTAQTPLAGSVQDHLLRLNDIRGVYADEAARDADTGLADGDVIAVLSDADGKFSIQARKAGEWEAVSGGGGAMLSPVLLGITNGVYTDYGPIPGTGEQSRVELGSALQLETEHYTIVTVGAAKYVRFNEAPDAGYRVTFSCAINSLTDTDALTLNGKTNSTAATPSAIVERDASGNIAGVANLVNDKIPKALLPALASGVRQTVLAAKTDAAGLPVFLTDWTTHPDRWVNGTPISGGDATTHKKEDAFDGSRQTWWASSQSGAGVSGVAYIGMDAGVGNTKAIRTVMLSTGSSAGTINSCKVQYSDNGTDWTDEGIYTLVATDVAYNRLALSSTPGARRFWRLLANANAAGAWSIYEVGFSESTTFGAVVDLFASAAEPCVLSFSAGADSTGILEYIEPLVEDQLAAWSVGVELQPPSNTAISGGNLSGAQTPDKAFDSNDSTDWASSQTNPNVSGNAYIGQGASAGFQTKITQLVVKNNTNANNAITSMKFQVADAPTGPWTDVQTFSGLTTTASANNTLTITSPVWARCWRLLANANPGTAGSVWGLVSITVTGEGISSGTNYLYAERDSGGSVTLGATTVAPVYQSTPWQGAGSPTTYLTDDLSSLTGWTTGGQGTMALSGNNFVASGLGSGSGVWHGPTAAKAIGSTLTDFVAEWTMTWNNTVASQTGRAFFYMLDASNNIVAAVSVYDGSAGGSPAATIHFIASGEAPSTADGLTGGTPIGSSPYAGNPTNFAGSVFKVTRQGANWTLQQDGVTLISGTGPTTAVANVKLGIQTYNNLATFPISHDNLLFQSVVAVATNADTFDYTKYIMCNPTGVKVQRLFLGECAVDANGVITSVTPYALQGKWDSRPITGWAGASNYTYSHNLGVSPRDVRVQAVNSSDDAVWTPAHGWYNAAYKGVTTSTVTRTTIRIDVNTLEVLWGTGVTAISKGRVFVARGW